VAQTLYEKLWRSHVVHVEDDGTALLYIDRHLLHEVSSVQAFDVLHAAGRAPWRSDTTLGVPDHNVPTTDRARGIADPTAKAQVDALTKNCARHGIVEFGMNDIRQGIVHVIGPELGATLPGMTLVCGDSHTTTHGALGTLSFGIGTSEVQIVLATQCLLMKPSKTMLIRVDGRLPAGVTAKDLVLTIIRRVGVTGASGHAIEYAGSAVTALTMEGRMTLCNMTIEMGARTGMVAVDQKTLDYVAGRPFAPREELWTRALAAWRDLHSDEGARFDRVMTLQASEVAPTITWGTTPDMAVNISERLPDPGKENDPNRRQLLERAFAYMGLQPNMPATEIRIDRVFVGSCTNGRIEDLRAAAAVLRGKRVAATVKQAMVVPGSGLVKQQAEREGLDKLFLAAGFEWRDPGCSMCLAMNADRLEPGERCASTTNRNFEGRQGAGGRTHLVSPAMAAAAAVAGHLVDVRGVN